MRRSAAGAARSHYHDSQEYALHKDSGRWNGCLTDQSFLDWPSRGKFGGQQGWRAVFSLVEAPALKWLNLAERLGQHGKMNTARVRVLPAARSTSFTVSSNWSVVKGLSSVAVIWSHWFRFNSSVFNVPDAMMTGSVMCA